MQCSLFFFLAFTLFFSNAVSLDIFVSPEAIANSPTLVSWMRASSDSADDLLFDLRFIRNGSDAGLAKANINLGQGDDSGHTNIVFPSNGSFELAAVTGFTNIGKSNTVAIIPPISTSSATPTPTPTATVSSTAVPSTSASVSSAASASSTGTQSTAVPSSTAKAPALLAASSSSSSSSSPTASTTPRRPHPNLPVLVGGILGALAGLGIIVALIIFLHRRRAAAARKRLTFHRDMMVQRRLSRAPSLPVLGLAHPRPSETFAEDVEQGLPHAELNAPPGLEGSEERAGIGGEAPMRSAPLGTGHIVPPPRGPRPAAAKRIGTLTTLRTTGSPLSSPRAVGMPATPTTPALAFPVPLSAPPGPVPAPAQPTTATRTPRQRDLAARQAMLRRQIADLTLELEVVSMRSPISAVSASSAPSGGRAGEIRVALEDMQRQMVWLRGQETGAWAMHLTDVLPPGHARYMRP